MRLTPNFTLRELGATDAPPTVRQNLQRTANGLQAFRDIVGVPFVVHSGWRTPDRNDAVGGSPTSDHIAGLAADVSLGGISLETFAGRLRDHIRGGGRFTVFDQLIFYPFTTGHIHFGFGRRMRRAVMIKNVDKGYSWAANTLYGIYPQDWKPAA